MRAQKIYKRVFDINNGAHLLFPECSFNYFLTLKSIYI